ncbi:hypothetical protein BJV74DRAFT_799586 [Russula compacta]|nr:hypothetical protein BJV74DRAFT_799586 [Russula compacta]
MQVAVLVMLVLVLVLVAAAVVAALTAMVRHMQYWPAELCLRFAASNDKVWHGADSDPTTDVDDAQGGADDIALECACKVQGSLTWVKDDAPTEDPERPVPP